MRKKGFMFNKKAIGILLSLTIAISSVLPVSATQNYNTSTENEIVIGNNNYDTDYWFLTFVTNTLVFGTDIAPGAYDVAYVKQADGSYTLRTNEKGDFSYDYSTYNWQEFKDDNGTLKKRLTFSANEMNNYTITTPKLNVNGGYKHTGWGYNFTIAKSDVSIEYPEYVLPAGESVTFDESIPIPKNTDKFWLFPILEYSTQSINEKFQTVSFNEDGHTVSANINITPAYTGSKIKVGDVIESFEIDGQKYSADKIKVKVSGDKKVGSEVTVTLQKVKGLDKATNAALKGKELGKVTIRPIVAQEIAQSSKTFTKEGQIVIKTKGDMVKAAYVLVPKKGKYSDSTKAKKLKIKVKDKSGSHVKYDQSAKLVTFNDTFVTGSAMAK